MITADIVSASQDFSFKDGTYANYLILQLPDGKVIRVTVDESVVSHISALFVQQGGPIVERAVSTAVATASTRSVLTDRGEMPVAGGFSGLSVDDPNQPAEFGGTFDGPDDAASAEEWVASGQTASSPAPVAPVQHRRGNLRVSADAGGNPVIQGKNVRDATEIAGGRAADLEEDGVGSV